MGLEKYSNQANADTVGVRSFFDSPIQNQSALNCFGNVAEMDYSGFDSNLSKYLNEKAITEMVKVNSEIGKIFRKFKLSIRIDMKILNNLVKNHLPQTRNIALGIANNLPHNFRAAVNRKALIEATSLHDIAKVIIPDNIINKAGALTDEEREIMEEHANLSYEMLKSTDLDKATLDLIKNHHQNPQKTGYPRVGDDFIADVNLQILSMADIYSALREKRSYKAEMSKEQALEIINKETEKGKFHPCIYQALVEYAQKEENLNKRNSKWQIFNFKPVNSFSS